MVGNGYMPEYLKLEPNVPVKYIGSSIIELVHSTHIFGMLSEPIFKSENPAKWVVLRYDPYCKEYGFNDSFESKEGAINDAILFLNKKGFNVKLFNLESLIDTI